MYKNYNTNFLINPINNFFKEKKNPQMLMKYRENFNM